MSRDRVEEVVVEQLLAQEDRERLGEQCAGIVRAAVLAGLELAASAVNMKRCATDCFVEGYFCTRCEILIEAERAIRSLQGAGKGGEP